MGGNACDINHLNQIIMMKKFKIEFDGKWYDAVEIVMPSGEGQDTFYFAEHDLFTHIDKYLDQEPQNKDAELLYNEIEFFPAWAHKADTEAEFLNILCAENTDFLELFNANVVRRCSVCGKVMQSGWMDNYSNWHACSDECRDKYYAEHGGSEAMAEDMEYDHCFYTEWESPFYD